MRHFYRKNRAKRFFQTFKFKKITLISISTPTIYFKHSKLALTRFNLKNATNPRPGVPLLERIDMENEMTLLIGIGIYSFFIGDTRIHSGSRYSGTGLTKTT